MMIRTVRTADTSGQVWQYVRKFGFVAKSTDSQTQTETWRNIIESNQYFFTEAFSINHIKSKQYFPEKLIFGAVF